MPFFFIKKLVEWEGRGTCEFTIKGNEVTIFNTGGEEIVMEGEIVLVYIHIGLVFFYYYSLDLK